MRARERETHSGCSVTTARHQDVDGGMEVQVINSAQVTVIVTDNLQKPLVTIEVTYPSLFSHHVGAAEFEVIHLLHSYFVCVYLVVFQIPALDLFVLSTGEQIRAA